MNPVPYNYHESSSIKASQIGFVMEKTVGKDEPTDSERRKIKEQIEI